MNEHKLLIMLYIKEGEKLPVYLEKAKGRILKRTDINTDLRFEVILNKRTVDIISSYLSRCKADGYLSKELNTQTCAMLLITIVWQTVLLNPYKFLDPSLSEEAFEDLLDNQIEIILRGMKPRK